MRSLAVPLACFTLAAAPSLLAQQRKCDDAKKPDKLPAPSALVDSARAMAELEPLGVPSEGVVFSLLFNETDSLPAVRLLEVADAEALARLGGALRPQKPAGVWAVRIRVRGGTTPGLTLERSVYCAPVLSQEPIGRTFVRVERRAGDRRLSLNRPTRVPVDVLVVETGEVEVVRLEQPTGIRDLDDEITRSWQVRRFLPALIDGRPISAWYRTDGRSPKL
jgi:hypothetical protein